MSFHCKSLQCFKAHPSPWLLPTGPRQRQKLQKCDSGSLGKEFYVSMYEIHQSVVHPPWVVYSQQSTKLVLWTWGVLISRRQSRKGSFWAGPFIGTGWISTLILVLEMKACTPEQWFERAQVRGEQASRGALAPEPELGIRLFVCRSVCLQSCRRSAVQDKCVLQLIGNILSHFLLVLLSGFIISLAQLLTW